MGFSQLIAPVLSVVCKLYCTGYSSNPGALLDHYPIPSTYKKLQKKTSNLTWINGALTRMGVLKDGVTVTTCTLTPFGQSNGYYSELACLQLEYSDNSILNLPTSCIVKFLPVGFEKRLILDLMQLPKSECLFYYYFLRNNKEHGLKPMPIHTPRILYSDYCVQTNNSTLIMERIYGRLGDQRRAPDIDEAKSCVITLAKVHAYFWGESHPDYRMLPRADNPLAQIIGVKMKMLLGSLFKVLKEETGVVPSPEMKECLTVQIPKHILKLLEWTVDSPMNAIVHGDARIDNFYFLENPEGSEMKYEAGLYDWAQGMYSPCFYEMAWTLASSFPFDFYEEHYETLLKLYWDNLMTELSPEIANESKHSDFLIGLGLCSAISCGKFVIAFESLTKQTTSPQYPHKKKLVLDGMRCALHLMEKYEGCESLRQVVDGKLRFVKKTKSTINGSLRKVHPS